MPDHPTPQPDRTDFERTQHLLGERYQLSWIIGRGGMATVWLARDTKEQRDVAVKVLKPEFTDNPEFRTRFRNEAHAAEDFHSENVVATYDYGEVADGGSVFCFIIMEYIKGETLADILRREHVLPDSMALDIIRQTANGLATIHAANMVHRDIKPGNMLITPEGVVKITDFGIAKAAEAVPLTRTGMVVGTAQYVSPEQAQGQQVTPASDIYSLGVVAYEVLSGRRPFRGESSVSVAIKHITEKPKPLPEQVSPNVQGLVNVCLRKNQEARYANGAELTQAAIAVAAGHAAPRPQLPNPADGNPAPTDNFAAATPRDDARGQLSQVAVGRGTAVPPEQGPAEGGVRKKKATEEVQPQKNGRGPWIAIAVLSILAAGLVGYLLISGTNQNMPEQETTTITNEVTTESSVPEEPTTDNWETYEPPIIEDTPETNPEPSTSERTTDTSQESLPSTSEQREPEPQAPTTAGDTEDPSLENPFPSWGDALLPDEDDDTVGTTSAGAPTDRQTANNIVPIPPNGAEEGVSTAASGANPPGNSGNAPGQTKNNGVRVQQNGVL